MTNTINVVEIPTIVISKDDFNRARHATIMQFKPKTFRNKLPPVAYMLEEDKAMVFGIENKITFRRRWSRETLTRSLQTIILDNSERLNEKVIVYLNEDIG